MRLRYSGLLVAILVLLVSFPAHAIVITWEYNISSTFTNTIFTANTPHDNITQTSTSLSWGDPAYGGDQSSLTIAPAIATGSVNTYMGGNVMPPPSEWIDTISLTHANNPIYEPSLLSTILATEVVLTPTITDPSTTVNPTLADQSFDMRIKFVETPNSGDYQNDVFALLDGFPNLNFSYDAGDGGGTIPYYVNVFPSDGQVLGILSSEYSQLAGVPYYGDGVTNQPTIGFTTRESHTTTLPFAFTISTERFSTPPSTVPEPSTILLLISGLAGLTFYRRKKK